MLKIAARLMVLLFSITLISACKSNPKAGEDTGAMGSDISSESMSFDASGSDSGKIAGLNTVNFDYDSATLSTDTRRKLAENAEWVKTRKNVTMQIEGHCDSRGSTEYNLALGERRATAVKNYLVSLGIDSKRLSIISFGEEKPIATGETEEAYAQNRRANFVPLTQ